VFFQELPSLSYFYSDESYFIPVNFPWQFSLNFFVNILSVPKFSQFYYFIVGAQVVFCILGLLNRFKIMSAIVVYFTTTMLHYKSYGMLTGGDTLINILLFYLIFLQPSSKDFNSKSLSTLWNASVFFIVQMQVVVLYFFSAYYKWLEYDWISGEAMFRVLINPDFSHPLIFENLNENNFLLSLSTWFVLIFQSLFPVLVYLRKFKGIFLFIGMLIHFSIFLIIGLFGFSFIMMIAYLVFYKFQWEKIPFWTKRILNLEYYGETKFTETLK
jgi:hypothetical protein